MNKVSLEEMGIAAILPGIQRSIDQLVDFKQSLLNQLAELRGRGAVVESDGVAVLAANGRMDWESIVTRALSQGPMNRASLQMAIDPHVPPQRRDPMHVSAALGRLVKSGAIAKHGELYSVGAGRTTPTGGSAYWSRMTPEQRSAEMRRRGMVAAKKATAKLHPRDPRHPGHDAWVEKMRQVNKATWAGLSKAERARRNAAMLAGRNKANGRAVSV